MGVGRNAPSLSPRASASWEHGVNSMEAQGLLCTRAMKTRHPSVTKVLRVVLVATGLAAMTATQSCADFQYNQNARMYGGPVPLTLVNDTARHACYIRISPSGLNIWGDDWLGPREIVHPGVSRTFYLAANGNWDLRIETCNRYEPPVAEVRGVRVPAATSLSMASLAALAVPQFSGGETASISAPPPPPPPPMLPPAPPTQPTMVTVAPWQSSATASVVINNPSAMSMDDVITLRDGTLLRGHVAELRPTQQVTIVLLSGETRVVAWDQLASTTGPSFTQGTVTFH